MKTLAGKTVFITGASGLRLGPQDLADPGCTPYGAGMAPCAGPTGTLLACHPVGSA